MNDELKPCPFCGSKNIEIDERGWDYFPVCENYHGGKYDPDKGEAILNWNTRPIEDELRAENAKLRAALEAVEWIEDRFEYRYCPWCSGSDNENDPNYGHATDCQRQIALGYTKEGEG